MLIFFLLATWVYINSKQGVAIEVEKKIKLSLLPSSDLISSRLSNVPFRLGFHLLLILHSKVENFFFKTCLLYSLDHRVYAYKERYKLTVRYYELNVNFSEHGNLKVSNSMLLSTDSSEVM